MRAAFFYAKDCAGFSPPHAGLVTLCAAVGCNDFLFRLEGRNRVGILKPSKYFGRAVRAFTWCSLTK